MSVVVALVGDLMDRSRFGALGAQSVDVRFVRTAEQLDEQLQGLTPPVTVVVDLARPDALEGIAAGHRQAARVLAYGSHVDRDRLDAAHAAGAEVLARSAFFSRLPDLLT